MVPLKYIKDSIKQPYYSKQHSYGDEFKRTKQRVNKLIKDAKLQYKGKTPDKTTTDMKSGWKGIKGMSYQNKRPPDISKSKSPHEIPKLADDLNQFYL